MQLCKLQYCYMKSLNETETSFFYVFFVFKGKHNESKFHEHFILYLFYVFIKFYRHNLYSEAPSRTASVRWLFCLFFSLPSYKKILPFPLRVNVWCGSLETSGVLLAQRPSAALHCKIMYRDSHTHKT